MFCISLKFFFKCVCYLEENTCLHDGRRSAGRSDTCRLSRWVFMLRGVRGPLRVNMISKQNGLCVHKCVYFFRREWKYFCSISIQKFLQWLILLGKHTPTIIWALCCPDILSLEVSNVCRTKCKQKCKCFNKTSEWLSDGEKKKTWATRT